jgi:hypothetical protein
MSSGNVVVVVPVITKLIDTVLVPKVFALIVRDPDKGPFGNAGELGVRIVAVIVDVPSKFGSLPSPRAPLRKCTPASGVNVSLVPAAVPFGIVTTATLLEIVGVVS